MVAVFGLIFVAGIAAGTRLHFDSNTLHTKSASSEAVQTLMRLLHNQVTNPFTISIMRPDVAQAAALAPRLAALCRWSITTINVLSLVPTDQPPKLAAPGRCGRGAGAGPSAASAGAGARCRGLAGGRGIGGEPARAGHGQVASGKPDARDPARSAGLRPRAG